MSIQPSGGLTARPRELQPRPRNGSAPGGAVILAAAGPVAMCAGGAAGAVILVAGFHKAKNLVWEGVSKTIRDVRAQNQQAWVAFNVKQASKKLQEAEAQLERLKQP